MKLARHFSIKAVEVAVFGRWGFTRLYKLAFHPLIQGGIQPKANVAVNELMNIVYNSDNYYVVEYPLQHGYEVVDKQSSRGTYFQGDVAEKFRESMIGALGEDSSPEHVDEFLSEFGVLINFPMTVH